MKVAFRFGSVLSEYSEIQDSDVSRHRTTPSMSTGLRANLEKPNVESSETGCWRLDGQRNCIKRTRGRRPCSSRWMGRLPRLQRRLARRLFARRLGRMARALLGRLLLGPHPLVLGRSALGSRYRSTGLLGVLSGSASASPTAATPPAVAPSTATCSDTTSASAPSGGTRPEVVHRLFSVR